MGENWKGKDEKSVLSALFYRIGCQITIEDDRNGGHYNVLWIFVGMLKCGKSGFVIWYKGCFAAYPAEVNGAWRLNADSREFGS